MFRHNICRNPTIISLLIFTQGDDVDVLCVDRKVIICVSRAKFVSIDIFAIIVYIAQVVDVKSILHPLEPYFSVILFICGRF